MARLYLDEDVARLVANALRERGHDTQTTESRGLKGQSDPRQLLLAAREERIFITCNRRDFELLHEAWILWPSEIYPNGGVDHSGILVIPNAGGGSATPHAESIDRFVRAQSLLSNRQYWLKSDQMWHELTYTSVRPP